MLFFESSAKTKIGIQQVFNEVVQKILENPNLLASTGPKKKNRVDMNAEQNATDGSACC